MCIILSWKQYRFKRFRKKLWPSHQLLNECRYRTCSRKGIIIIDNKVWTGCIHREEPSKVCFLIFLFLSHCLCMGQKHLFTNICFSISMPIAFLSFETEQDPDGLLGTEASLCPSFQVRKELVCYLVKEILQRMQVTRLQPDPQTDHQTLIMEDFPEKRKKITVCWGVKRNMGHILSFRLKILF